MNIYAGIDIGGTFTDYVALADTKLLLGGKLPNKDNYLDSFVQSLEKILENVTSAHIKRLVISTTFITNFITAKKYTFPECIILPGPGIKPDSLHIPQHYKALDATMDFRGREIKSFTQADRDKLRAIKSRGCAIVGKFSGRNPRHEIEVGHYLSSYKYTGKLYYGHECSGELGFPRRVNTTLFYAATQVVFNDFCKDIKQVLQTYGLLNKAYFLKSNGAIAKITDENINPVETVFSGPVGSVLGAKALTSLESFLTIDIGGTTTDFAIVLNNKPLYAERGISIDGYPTAVSAFAVYSCPLGGDSPIDCHTGRLLSKRLGPAVAFGGKEPTLTDALNVIGLTKAGNYLASQNRLILKIAQLAVNHALDILSTELTRILGSWKSEPAYHIWEMKLTNKYIPSHILGLGGGAQGLTEELAKKLGMQAHLVKNHEIANAIGTALAKPTVTASFYVDTAQKKFVYIEKGTILPALPSNIDQLMDMAHTLAKENYNSLYNIGQLEDFRQEIVVTRKEQFNVVRGFSTSGKIMDAQVLIPADVIFKVVS